MTDRELLELAARAAGAEHNGYRFGENGREPLFGMPVEIDDGIAYQHWDPLADDGDALRLAVELGIDIEWRADGRVAAYRHANADGHCFTAFESSREDRQENTRRAIVQAAAEIGKTLGE